MEVFTLSPDATAGSVRSTVVVGATELPFDMKRGKQYRFTSTVNCYARLTSAGGAAASANNGSTLCVAGQVLLFTAVGTALTRVSVIRESADGACTLTEILKLPSE